MPANAFRAVIFDLDGVLADSEPWWTKIDAALLAGYGVTYGGEYHREVLGVSYSIAIEFYRNAFGITAPADEMMRRREQIAIEFFAQHIGVFPSARAVLEQLRQMDLRLGVGTSSVSACARPFLERHALTGFFDAVVSGEEVARGKPYPDIYLRVAELLAVAPRQCLVIEDALSGIAAAKAARMSVAAIPDARFVDARPYAAAADYLLKELSEIPALVRPARTA
jgi:HAD superfamily hydrolase (TIGR01509 family)